MQSLDVDYIALLLAFIYFFLFAAELKQLVDIFWLKNRLLNYRNGIIVIMTFACLLRVVFWSKTAAPTQCPITLFMIFFYLPVWLNFAALSLLSLFYANAIYNNTYGNWPVRICVGLNVVFLLLNLTIACMLREVTTHHTRLYVLYICYAIFLDGLTALFVGYFGHRFVSMHAGQGTQFLLPRSVEEFSAVNWILVLAFLGRSVFVGVLSSGSIVSEEAVKVEFNGSHKHTSAALLAFFVLSEVVPNLCMLYLLWRSSSRPAAPRAFKSDSYEGYTEYDLYDSLRVGYDSVALRTSSAEDSIIKVIYGQNNDEEEGDGEEGGERDTIDLYRSPLMAAAAGTGPVRIIGNNHR